MLEKLTEELLNEIHRLPSLYVLFAISLVVLAGTYVMMWFDEHKAHYEEEA